MTSQNVMADRFPTADEAQALVSSWSPDQLIDSGEVDLRLSRMMADVLHAGPPGGFPLAPTPHPGLATGPAGAADGAQSLAAGAPFMPAPMPVEQVRGLVTRLVRAAQRVRKDHRQLTQAERDLFNDALQQAHGMREYKELVDAHMDMGHRHHGAMPGMPPSAAQRFLPWHRAYGLKFEDLLRTVRPAVTIPYWDYANDHARPDWVWQPPA